MFETSSNRTTSVLIQRMPGQTTRFWICLSERDGQWGREYLLFHSTEEMGWYILINSVENRWI